MRHSNLLLNGLKLSMIMLFLILGIQFSNAQTITTNTQNTSNGWFYSFWNDNQSGSASMTLGAAGNYSTTWNNVHNFTAGKGWKTGSPNRIVCFEGTFNGGSNGFLAVYGWTKDPLIEYYVVESYGNWTPPGNTSDIIYKGTFTCDGGTYKIYTSTRTNQPSIIGTATFQQYWSVRSEKRSTGSVDFAKHIAEWKKYGMNMGTTWDYQIMESEGYMSSGSSNITVSECNTPTTTVKITAPTASTAFAAPATINITATASSTSVTISKVEFYNGTTKLGEDASSPYSYSWTNVAAGSYSLTAVATDNSGTKTTSDPVVVKVTGPQTPYGGTPAAIPGVIEFENFDEGGNDNAYYDSSPGSEVTPVVNFRTNEDVDIENCTDAGGGYNLGYTVAGEWTEYTVDVKTAGKYDLVLRVACSGTGRTISITAKGVAIATNLAIPNTNGWQTWTDLAVNNITLEAGVQIIRVTIGATDYVNLNKMTFAAQAAPTPPTVAITAPATNAEYTVGQKVTINATATSTSSTISKVEFFVNNTSIGTDNTSPYTFDWTSTSAGTYAIKAVATDANALTGNATINVVVKAATPPTVSITAPATGTEFTTGDVVTINATASSSTSTVSKVEFFVNDVLKSTDNSSPYSYSWTATPAGSYVLKVVATDATGLTSNSSVSLVVKDPVVVVSIPLKKGWNIIGYPYIESQNVEVALSGILPNLLIVKDFEGFWASDMQSFLQSLTQLSFGKGYYVKVDRDCTLIWK